MRKTGDRTLDTTLAGGVLLLLLLALALTGLAWQVTAIRTEMVQLVDRQLAVARHGIPTLEQLAEARAQFDALQAELAWRARTASALGLAMLALAVVLLLGAAVRPRRSPVSEAIARLQAAVDDSCRLAARLRPVSSHVSDDFRTKPKRR